MELEETEIYKNHEIALDAMYQLEDLTGYADEEVGRAIAILQNFDVKKACEDNMIVIPNGEEDDRRRTKS